MIDRLVFAGIIAVVLYSFATSYCDIAREFGFTPPQACKSIRYLALK